MTKKVDNKITYSIGFCVTVFLLGKIVDSHISWQKIHLQNLT